MIEETPETWRYEVKFVLRPIDEYALVDWLCTAPFVYRSFLPRVVNSIYLDNLSFDCAQSNLDGIQARTKYRFRFYGNDWNLKNSLFEIKLKRGRLGKKYKSDFPIDPREFIKKNYEEREKILSTIPVMRNDPNTAIGLLPVLAVQYERDYYLAPEGIRITVDRKLHFKMIEIDRHIDPMDRWAESMIVLEFKYPTHQKDMASRIMSTLPFRATRSSKYLQGMANLGMALYV